MAQLAQPRFGRLSDFVDELQSRGRYSFTKTEATDALECSVPALTLALNRLAKKRRIAMVRRGLYVIVPHEYSVRGILPPEWFINELMSFLSAQYYVGLLTAAEFHGAAHQRPQQFQVISDRQVQEIRVRGLSIGVFRKANVAAGGKVARRTVTGDIPVSCAELTALDLVSYQSRIGGLDRVATVLAELSESMDAERLAQEAACYGCDAAAQRVGYLLGSVLGEVDLTKGLLEWVKQRRPRYAAIAPANTANGRPRDRHWRVVINETVESEI